MIAIVDLDDTLLRTDGTISGKTIKIIQKWKDAGHLFIFNSARSYERMHEYIKLLQPDYVIANGGAEIYNQDSLLKVIEIETNIANEIVSIFVEHQLDFSVWTKTTQYSSDVDYVLNNTFVTYRDWSEQSLQEPVSKIVVKTIDEQWLRSILEKYHLQITRYVDGNWFRISRSTKAIGNQILFELLHLKDIEDYCFGDDIGDLEMLQKAFVGVAMKNSVKHVIENIKTQTDYTNNEDGVALYLEKLLEKTII